MSNRVCLGILLTLTSVIGAPIGSANPVPAKGGSGQDRFKALDPQSLLKFVPASLKYEHPTIPAADNGYVEASEAINFDNMTLPEGWITQTSVDTSIEQAKVRTLRTALQPNIAKLRKAVARPRWVLPFTGPETVFPEFQNYRTMARALALLARLEMREGNSSAALDYLVLGRKMAKRLRNCEGLLITQLVGIACDAIVNRTLQDLIWSPSVDSSNIDALEKALPAPIDLKTELEMVAKVELNGMILPAIAKMTSAGSMFKDAGFNLAAKYDQIFSKHKAPIDKEATAKMAVEYALLQFENAAKPYSAWKSPDSLNAKYLSDWPKDLDMPSFSDQNDRDALAPLDANRLKSLQASIAPIKNPLGIFLISTAVLTVSEQPQFRSVAIERATTIIVTMRSFSLAHSGGMPKDLSGLNLPESLTTDPFNGKPFRYDPTRKLIWSVGADGRDDGGNDIPWRTGTNPKDLVFSINSSR